MKGSSFLLLLPMAAAACSATGGGPAWADRLLYWPPGQYVLEASVRYDRATEFAVGTVTEEYMADLNIATNGSMILTSSSGSCQDPSPAETRRDESQGRKSFQCGNVTYYLRPTGGSIGGEILASVPEETRERGPCIRSAPLADDGQRCARYSWTITRRMTNKRARLRVLRGS